MITFAGFFFSLLLFSETRVNAVELLLNGGFEQPSTDGLSPVFHVKKKLIMGCQFAGGDEVLVNYPRSMLGDGFQSLLLPYVANNSSTLWQEFAVNSAPPSGHHSKLAASKAVDGDVHVVLDDKTIKNIRLSDF